MNTAKIAITLDQELLRRMDQLVRKHLFPNRSKAIQAAVEEKLLRMDQTRLSQECAKLNRREERALADEISPSELDQWPRF